MRSRSIDDTSVLARRSSNLGHGGPHTSRIIMLEDLETLFLSKLKTVTQRFERVRRFSYIRVVCHFHRRDPRGEVAGRQHLFRRNRESSTSHCDQRKRLSANAVYAEFFR